MQGKETLKKTIDAQPKANKFHCSHKRLKRYQDLVMCDPCLQTNNEFPMYKIPRVNCMRKPCHYIRGQLLQLEGKEPDYTTEQVDIDFMCSDI